VSGALRLLLVDDDVLVRSGLRVLLESEPDLIVVGEAGTGREALEVAAGANPDVVVMDVRMPDMDGIAATAALVARDSDRPRVLVLTTFEDDDYLYRALLAGASGFALKRSSPDELAHAIRVVASGTSLVLPDLTRRLIAGRAERSRPQGAAALPDLTAREADVLRQLAAGLSNHEIAARLHLSRETVKSHVSSLLIKLGARDRTQAVIAAYESGFLDQAG
jgi:DNA-binding NarL/FixJ family response regulator